MLLRIGSVELDTARRPLVIAVVRAEVGDLAVAAAVKQVHSLGADVAEVAGDDLDPQTCRQLGEQGLSWSVATDVPQVAARAIARGAVALRWTGPRSVDAARPAVAEVPVLAPFASPWLREGDWGVVGESPGNEVVSRAAAGVLPIVDLGPEADRARVAAAVTIGLEHGAQGFRTFAPRAVRRSAFVVRALERSR